jgi:IclR family acetate operon transcriptional repressor
MKDTNSRTSPRRILNILEEIIIDPNNFTAKKISHKLKIPLPTIYRHIETLCEEKYLVSSSSKSYLPGPKMRNLILKSLPYEPNFTLRRSYLRKLTNDIEETVSLSIPIGTKLVYFDRIEFHWPMQLNLEAGDHLPLHASASGKLYLSTITEEKVIQIFRNIKTPKNGMVGLSVPIFNSNKELCFCLSTHTAKSRKDINDLKKILSIMLSSANNLKKVLFKD